MQNRIKYLKVFKYSLKLFSELLNSYEIRKKNYLFFGTQTNSDSFHPTLNIWLLLCRCCYCGGGWLKFVFRCAARDG